MKLATVKVEKGGKSFIVNACDLAAYEANGWALEGTAKPKTRKRAERKPVEKPVEKPENTDDVDTVKL